MNHVVAALKRLTFAVALASCATNEVLVALGADADSDGDLLMDEADIVFDIRIR